MKPDEYIGRPGCKFSEVKWLISEPDPETGRRQVVAVDAQGEAILRGAGTGRLATDPPEPKLPWWKEIFAR